MHDTITDNDVLQAAMGGLLLSQIDMSTLHEDR